MLNLKKAKGAGWLNDKACVGMFRRSPESHQERRRRGRRKKERGRRRKMRKRERKIREGEKRNPEREEER